MRMKFYTVLVYGTLFVDAYLVLASLAARMMQAQYRTYLSPFGSDGVSNPQHIPVLMIATWTAVLAIGCLKTQSSQTDNTGTPGTVWFIVVLSTVWLIEIVPILINVARGLFLHGF